MSESKIYIRVKRRNQTFCFLCDASDTVLSVKEKVVAAANQHCGEDDGNKISAEFLRLLKTDSNTTILNDADSLNDCELVTTGDGDNDVVLHVVVQIADDEWESVDVVPTNLEDAAVS